MMHGLELVAIVIGIFFGAGVVIGAALVAAPRKLSRRDRRYPDAGAWSQRSERGGVRGPRWPPG